MWYWLKIILCSAGIAGCVALIAWVKLAPRKWDGCIYKPPGFHREKWRGKRATGGNKPAPRK
jgi:hypothetical protein